MDDLAGQLPAAAADLVRSRSWGYQQYQGSFMEGADFTTEEARELATALGDAGFEQDERANMLRLEYRFEYQNQGVDQVIRIEFWPRLPEVA